MPKSSCSRKRRCSKSNISYESKTFFRERKVLFLLGAKYILMSNRDSLWQKCFGGGRMSLHTAAGLKPVKKIKYIFLKCDLRCRHRPRQTYLNEQASRKAGKSASRPDNNQLVALLPDIANKTYWKIRQRVP